MIRHALPRKRVSATLCGLALVEWVLFELVRAPYRPPQDMTTFLGAEKYGVIAVMLVLAVFGFGLLLWWAVRSAWTSRDIAAVAFLATGLLVAGSIVVIAPTWPVTPFRLLLR